MQGWHCWKRKREMSNVRNSNNNYSKETNGQRFDAMEKKCFWIKRQFFLCDDHHIFGWNKFSLYFTEKKSFFCSFFIFAVTHIIIIRNNDQLHLINRKKFSTAKLRWIHPLCFTIKIPKNEEKKLFWFNNLLHVA